MKETMTRPLREISITPGATASSESVDGVRLIARPDIVAGPEDWPPVWFSFAQHTWNSMALVPAHAGVSVLAVARALADAGRTYDAPSMRLIEAERVPTARLQSVCAEIRGRSELMLRTIVSVPSPLDDNSAVPIIRSCDVAVLVVPLGDTSLASARRTLTVVGRGAFLGAITVSSV
jgi:hypothetical protein